MPASIADRVARDARDPRRVARGARTWPSWRRPGARARAAVPAASGRSAWPTIARERARGGRCGACSEAVAPRSSSRSVPEGITGHDDHIADRRDRDRGVPCPSASSAAGRSRAPARTARSPASQASTALNRGPARAAGLEPMDPAQPFMPRGRSRRGDRRPRRSPRAVWERKLDAIRVPQDAGRARRRPVRPVAEMLLDREASSSPGPSDRPARPGPRPTCSRACRARKLGRWTSRSVRITEDELCALPSQATELGVQRRPRAATRLERERTIAEPDRAFAGVRRSGHRRDGGGVHDRR